MTDIMAMPSFRVRVPQREFDFEAEHFETTQ